MEGARWKLVGRRVSSPCRADRPSVGAYYPDATSRGLPPRSRTKLGSMGFVRVNGLGIGMDDEVSDNLNRY